MKALRDFNERFVTILNEFQDIPFVFARMTLGWVFVESGWAKFIHLAKVTEFFAALGIPAPNVMAPFVAGVELTCGLLVSLGLFTRLGALPLLGVMAVAIATAKQQQISDFSSVLGFSEFLYIGLILFLVFFGAGKLSVDRYLKVK